MSKKTVVTVTMRKENGWYIATSPDLEGFIVCHQNFLSFSQEIPACIKALYIADHGIEVDVEELPSIDGHDLGRIVFEATKRVA